jgi:hypothetical protein
MASPYIPTTPAAPLPPDLTTPVPDPAAAGPAAGNRALGRRPALPGGRALIGAALVVAAAVLTYAAYLGANAGPAQTYVVPRRDLQPNDRVTAADFRLVAGELPAEVSRGAFATAAELDGAVILAPLAADALVPRSAVSTGGGGAERAEGFEVSFTVPRWKLGGDRVRAGELIDLVPTGDRNEAARAAGPVRNVRVIDRSEGTTGLGSATGDVTVSVSAPDQPTYLGIVEVVRGEFWVVRSTRAAGGGTPPAAVAPTTSAVAPTTNGFGFPATPGPTATPAPPTTSAGAAATTTTARRP